MPMWRRPGCGTGSDHLDVAVPGAHAQTRAAGVMPQALGSNWACETAPADDSP